MKKKYEAPTLETEIFELSECIASHCGIVVSNGPAVAGHEQCDDYKDPFAAASGASAYSRPHNVQFYDDTNCDCYTTGGDYGYWTS